MSRLVSISFTVFQRPFRLLDRDCVNKRYLDLFKEILWVSVGQRVVEIWAVKVGGKKISAALPGASKQVRTGQSG